MRRSLFRLRALLLMLALGAVVLSPTACITVKLVGDYDQQIDQTATQLQKRMDTFLTKLENLPNGDAGRQYAPNKKFYLQYGVDLRALETRATSLQKQSITVQQVQLMESSLEQLRSTHATQDDLSAASLDEYRQLFNTAWTAILTFELAKRRS